MKYHKTITLKDGRTCMLRNGTAEDGRALLKIFNLTHTQTDYLRTYPEEHSYTAEDEAELLRRNRPVTTLFMLMSVDGKISTGAADELDVDRDFPKIAGLREGLHQYYEIEQTTDLWSFNTGRVQAKMGVNTAQMPEKIPVSFVLLDNHHLSEHGVRYLCLRSKQFVLITTNREHPAFAVKEENLHIIFQEKLSLTDAFTVLKEQFGCERLTVQSVGTVNGLLLREKLFDFVDLVVAPVLIGGKDTATLIDGQSLRSASELSRLGVLRLIDVTPLQNSYLRLRYQVIG